MQLTARASYLFHQAGIDPSGSSALEIVARKTRALRDLIRHWWETLEPEATAGVVVSMMEEALAAFADESRTKSDRSFTRKWARSWFDWKPRMMQSRAEQMIGERFLVAAERLGVLVSRGSRLTFSHDALHEVYLGVHYLAHRTLPPLAARRTDLYPLKTAEAHAVIARLSLTPADERRAVLAEVAQRSLLVATWFLWGDDEARAEHGDWMAAEVLSELQWGQPAVEQELLENALESLSTSALPTCRKWLDAREANLPAHLIAIRFLARHGNAEDLPRMQRLIDDPQLGQWEIDQMRQMLRDAEAKVVDAEARKLYTRQEMIELAKDTAAILLKIAGTIAVRTANPLPWGENTVVAVAGTVADGAGETMAAVSPSEFFRAQQQMRGLLAVLPGIIEQRKMQIHQMAPVIREAAQAAVLSLRR